MYKHIAKEYQRLREERETRKCYKCNKIGYLAKDCKLEQKIKNRSIYENSDEESNDKQKGFVRGLK